MKGNIIYAINNKQTGQYYIGRTDNLERRKRRHFSWLKHNKHHCPHLQSAYNKYGKVNFNMVALCQGLTKDEAVELEQLILDECYDTLYNCSRSALTPDRTGCKHTAEAKKKMSGENNHFYGKSHSEDAKAKMSEAKKGAKHPRSKPFTVKFPDGQVDQWASASEAAETYGVGRTSIFRYLNGENTQGGDKRTKHLKDTVWTFIKQN